MDIIQIQTLLVIGRVVTHNKNVLEERLDQTGQDVTEQLAVLLEGAHEDVHGHLETGDGAKAFILDAGEVLEPKE